MKCTVKGKKLRSHNTSYCLIDVVTKAGLYVVNQKLEYVDDIIFRELLGRIRVVFFYKEDLSVPSTRYLYLRWLFFFI